MEKTVQQIRTTSPFFSTATGVQVYAELKDLKKSFPNIEKVGQYASGDSSIAVFDDREQGIAFELYKAGSKTVCTGIIVHKKGEPVLQIYFTLHPNMRRLP